MKKTSFTLVIIIFILFILCFSVFGKDIWSYDFIIDGIEVNISSEEEITEAFAYNIAHNLICGNDSIAKGTYCDLYGHTFVTTTATTIIHRYYSTAPRCWEKVYSVKTCTICGYETRTLINSSRIFCCD